MNLDDLMDAWRSQDLAPLHGVNRERLQEALMREQATRRRALRIEARIIYGISVMLFGGLAFILALMVFDDDPRTAGDFVLVALGAAAALLWAGYLYLGRRRQALRERRFGASLRDEIGRHLALLDYETSRVWRLSSVLLTTLPMCFSTFALWAALGRINNLPIDWWGGVTGALTLAAAMVWGFWMLRRATEPDGLRRKRGLEELQEQLKDS